MTGIWARRGAAGQQYAIIVGLIGVVALFAIGSLGGNVRALFVNTSNVLSGAGNGIAPVVTQGGGGGGTGLPYPFTTHTFTPCGATGANGPTLGDCKAAYTSSEAAGWRDVAERYTVTAGIQRWTVPETGSYRITAQGAQGACSGGGTPATMRGDFSLNQGDVLHLLVGQRGLCWTNGNDRGGGGGGSFVVLGGTAVRLVAGGGGAGNGTAGSATTGLNAPNPAEAQNCGAGRGGLDGGGGGGGGNYGGGGGGGFNTNGGTGGNGGYGYSGGGAGTSSTAGGNGGGPTPCVGQGGISFLNGGTGGGTGCNISILNVPGGFGGGGGGPSGNISGGGGGGWSGGAGGHYSSTPCSAGHVNQSTGGASINLGTSPSNSVSGSGDGFIIILKQ